MSIRFPPQAAGLQCLDGMRIGQRVFICTLLGGVALGAQGEWPSSAAAMTHIGKGYELVQNDRLAEAAQEFRADKSEVINNLILSAIIILGITIGRGLASAIFTSGIVEP
jgi:hypothetical protein